MSEKFMSYYTMEIQTLLAFTDNKCSYQPCTIARGVRVAFSGRNFLVDELGHLPQCH